MRMRHIPLQKCALLNDNSRVKMFWSHYFPGGGTAQHGDGGPGGAGGPGGPGAPGGPAAPAAPGGP